METKSGIDELRELVNMAGWTRESAFDGLDAIQVIKLLRACRELDLEVLPDELTPAERVTTARTGKVPTAALRRLYANEGLPETGRDWEGR